jgi:hypothetical protein
MNGITEEDAYERKGYRRSIAEYKSGNHCR